MHWYVVCSTLFNLLCCHRNSIHIHRFSQSLKLFVARADAFQMCPLPYDIPNNNTRELRSTVGIACIDASLYECWSVVFVFVLIDVKRHSCCVIHHMCASAPDGESNRTTSWIYVVRVAVCSNAVEVCSKQPLP